MDRDYLQEALAHFNIGKPQWYGWKKEDNNGNKIPNNQRMTYENIVLNDSTATLPSKADVDAKIQEIKDADTARANAKTSAINKLKGATYSALTDAEAKALFGA
jgi:hypothetical protein|tara:strand:- start:3 stop:314 length:312 start_codon:yes stop_codon:yes gene_type:complete